MVMSWPFIALAVENSPVVVVVVVVVIETLQQLMFELDKHGTWTMIHTVVVSLATPLGAEDLILDVLFVHVIKNSSNNKIHRMCLDEEHYLQKTTTIVAFPLI